MTESSRARYRAFRDAYRAGALEDPDQPEKPKDGDTPPDPAAAKTKRRQYVRQYLRWLTPHRGAVAVVMALSWSVMRVRWKVPPAALKPRQSISCSTAEPLESSVSPMTNAPPSGR